MTTTTVNAARLPKISADSHVEEPHDLWFERMAAELRDRAPRRIEANVEGGWRLVVDGSDIGWEGVSTKQEAQALDDDRIAVIAPAAREAMMRADGLNGEIVYPTIGLYTYGIDRRTWALPSLGRALAPAG